MSSPALPVLRFSSCARVASSCYDVLRYADLTSQVLVIPAVEFEFRIDSPELLCYRGAIRHH